MASAGRSVVIIVSLVTLLLVFVSAVEYYYDDRYAAVVRRSRLGTRHVHHRRTTVPVPHLHVLAEKSSMPGDGGSLAPPTEQTSGLHRSHKHWVRNRIIGFVVGSLAGIISGPVLFVLSRLALNCIRGRSRSRSGVIIFTLNPIRRPEHLAFLEKEDGLASLAVIGRGGCGEVYKAQLPVEVEREGEQPRFIAIKKINLGDERQRERRSRQILSEIRTVGHIRHRNLLPLAAHVPRPDCHYLVYEYMENGSLEQALKVEAGGNVLAGSSARPGLPWHTRLRVAVGVAAGLEYLHFSHKPQIIHRDLKPANILLDEDLQPRIADFGLAKDMPDSRSHVTASCVAGTAGYMAPEYQRTFKFTAKCDVYSFGIIILMELATGKKPNDQFITQTDELAVGLVKWLRRVTEDGEHARAIDPAIAGAGYDEQILLLMRIALFCTKDNPKERPTAKDIRCMLSQIGSSLAS